MSKVKKTDWWVTKWWKKDKKKEKKSEASSYWYDDYSSDFDYTSFYKGWDGYDEKQAKSYQRTQDLYKLSSARRAIANFVNIVTGRNIPVQYATRSQSYTDGKSVTLSADVNDNFDVSVGLALHEGSHIVLSQFDILEAINATSDVVCVQLKSSGNASLTPKQLGEFIACQAIPTLVNTNRVVNKYSTLMDRIFNPVTGLYRHSIPNPPDNVVEMVHAVTNWIEDRRIDAYIYKNAPGYRQYYLKLYDHYFNSKDVTKGIESDEFTDETVEAYIFRIVNFTNEKSDLNKLKGLRKIYGMIDLNRIGRLQSTEDSMNLAIDVIEEIYKNCGSPMFDKSTKSNGAESGAGEGDSIEITDIMDGDSDEQGGAAGQVGGQMTGQMSNNPSSQGKDGNTKSVKVTLSKTAMEKLQKAIQKQKDFLNDKIKRKMITKDEEKSLKNIDESGSEIVNVGSDVSTRDYYGQSSGTQSKGVDCIVIKRVTPAMLSDDSDFTFYQGSGRDGLGRYHTQVQDGIKLGTALGNKLSVRSESRDTVFNRLNKGKIDQRLISGLGYGAESVFYTREVDQYKRANLHISVDYSGSMQGNRIQNAIVCTTAIVKAATMARNINVQVSIRSTTSGHKCLPIIALIYDSRRDNLKWFCDVMSKLQTTNTTPEGLCFEAIMKNFVPSNKDVDSYFLNMSDGEPCFQTNGYNYSGDPAAQHTARQIKRMQEDGMNVLSYFINNSPSESARAWQIFKKCYGEGARQIDPRNILQIAKTMNEMFLKKGKRTE